MMKTNRRQFFPIAGSLLTSTAPRRRPNLLFIQTDDQRFDDLGCAGNSVIHTPHLDALAAQGVYFGNAFVTTAICCSSRASVLTGQHMWRHGIRDFATPLSASQIEQTYPVLLQKSGYRTAFIGKYGVGSADGEPGVVDSRGFAPGAARPTLGLPGNRFDFWFGFPQSINFLQMVNGQKRHLTPLMTDRAIEFLRSGPPERPFCLSINFKEPHGPVNFLDPDVPDRYKEAEIPAPATFTQRDFDSQPEFIRRSTSGTKDGRWPAQASEQFLRGARTAYRLIEGVDRAVGRIMEELRKSNLDQNTVVIFTSDNGTLRGAHGLRGKWLAYEESIRVPLIVRDPRLPAHLRGSRRTEMALNIDLAPTMLSLAGVPVPSEIHGRDLCPLISGAKVEWRKDWYYEHTYVPEDDRQPIARSEAVRTDSWKYIRYTDTTPRSEQLFDLTQDPHERQNLANELQHKATLEALRTRWRRLRRSAE